MGLSSITVWHRALTPKHLQVKLIPEVLSDDKIEHGGRLLGCGGYSKVLEVVASQDGFSDEESESCAVNKQLYLSAMRIPESFLAVR